MTTKLVVLDFDGTLADSLPWLLREMNNIAQRFRFHAIAENEVETVRHYSARQLLKYLQISWYKVPWISRHVRHRMNQEIKHIALFSGIANLLEICSALGIQLAIQTANSKINVTTVLGKDLTEKIQFFECGISLFGKVRSLKRLMRLSGFVQEEILLVGDEIRDLQAAQKLNIPCVAVSWGYTNAQGLATIQPDFLVETPEQLLELIKDRV